MDLAAGQASGFISIGGQEAERCPDCGMNIDRLSIIDGKYDIHQDKVDSLLGNNTSYAETSKQPASRTKRTRRTKGICCTKCGYKIKRMTAIKFHGNCALCCPPEKLRPPCQ